MTPARRTGWRSPVWSAMAPPCENPARTIRRAGMPRAVSCSISASTWACEARTPASSSPRRPSRSRTSYQARITAAPVPEVLDVAAVLRRLLQLRVDDRDLAGLGQPLARPADHRLVDPLLDDLV